MIVEKNNKRVCMCGGKVSEEEILQGFCCNCKQDIERNREVLEENSKYLLSVAENLNKTLQEYVIEEAVHYE